MFPFGSRKNFMDTMKGSQNPPYSYDPYLLPYKTYIDRRLSELHSNLQQLGSHEGGIASFSSGWDLFGLRKTSGGWTFAEYLPGAQRVSLIGDFNGWNSETHRLAPTEFGRWSITIPGVDTLLHGQKYKLAITQIIIN